MFIRVLLVSICIKYLPQFNYIIYILKIPDQYIGNLMRRDMFISYIEFLENLFFDCGWPRRMAGTPMKVRILRSLLVTQ